ncbi:MULTISPECIES: hypothetical protein [Leptospira]|uniref:Uncharacterized protein n=3 Tax=Leptospira weilii TaxID=28184 RepID=A0A828YZP9_9LEPT|nr:MULTISPECIES: hypothetical protein [Leptospira]EMM72827.1 hypothetical protein LEP1GSC038_2036 [Leptospira weilii str. 2006001855]EKR63357.1 hypothetical protein LEP1GSC036_2151 [Leptospira weilii str. 2006001853]EMJ60522.1 hypothetical protein LEP1GSC051_2766 [Leptospira sp. P2653]EMN43829.1 hypothetical protein LEP1GSC086_4440 [Leptospira weilii str. LNT 1234]EMN91438.1 hypothetical protein LEP1GSC108_0961 [Leptospira weilii str. UI 13098]
MIISWEKMRHPHPKEEWKKLLEKVDVIQEKRGSSHRFSKKHPCIEKKTKEGTIGNSFFVWHYAKQIEKGSSSN